MTTPNLTIKIGTDSLRAFLLSLPGVAEKTKGIINRKMFDVAVRSQETATRMTPLRTGRLTNSILAYGVRDGKGRSARRGISSSLTIGATVPHAELMHEGIDDEPYFLGIGRQTRTDKKASKKRGNARRIPIRVPRADLGGGTEIRMGWKIKGSVAKFQKTGVVGWKFLERALDEHRGVLEEWPELGPKMRKLVEDNVRRANKQNKPRTV